MFAYCLNNPVNGCDPCGTCFHNLKFYDCEKCSAFWGGVREWCEDAYNTINQAYQQQVGMQNEIARQQVQVVQNVIDATNRTYAQQQELQNYINTIQLEFISNATNATWNAFERGYAIQQEALFRDAKLRMESIEYIFDNPLQVLDLARDMGAASASVCAVVSTALSGGSPVIIAAAVFTAGVAIYDAVRTIGDVLG